MWWDWNGGERVDATYSAHGKSQTCPQCVRSQFSWLHPDLPFCSEMTLSMCSMLSNPGSGYSVHRSGYAFCLWGLLRACSPYGGHLSICFLQVPALCPSPQRTQPHPLLGVQAHPGFAYPTATQAPTRHGRIDFQPMLVPQRMGVFGICRTSSHKRCSE